MISLFLFCKMIKLAGAMTVTSSANIRINNALGMATTVIMIDCLFDDCSGDEVVYLVV